MNIQELGEMNKTNGFSRSPAILTSKNLTRFRGMNMVVKHDSLTACDVRRAAGRLNKLTRPTS